VWEANERRSEKRRERGERNNEEVKTRKR